MGYTPGRWSQDANTASGPGDSEKRRTVREGRPEQGPSLFEPAHLRGVWSRGKCAGAGVGGQQGSAPSLLWDSGKVTWSSVKWKCHQSRARLYP